MFPHTPKWSKKLLISFRLRRKHENSLGYVPRYERTPKNEGVVIHSVFATHVETVCLLSNRKADSHIKLSLDMDEYYDIIEKEQADNK